MTDLADRIAAAKLKADQAKARVQKLEARASEAARKIDTRRKVILGSLLLERASRERNAHYALEIMIAGLTRDQDKAAFAGFVMPPRPAPSVPSARPAAAPSASVSEPVQPATVAA